LLIAEKPVFSGVYSGFVMHRIGNQRTLPDPPIPGSLEKQA